MQPFLPMGLSGLLGGFHLVDYFGRGIGNQTVSFTDLMTTFAEIVGTDLLANAAEDSFSLLPVLMGEQSEERSIRPPVVSVSSHRVRAIQDRKWKLIEGLGSGGFTDPSHVEPGPGDPEGQLYNLEEDPAETNNLWHEYPEVVDRSKQFLKEYDQSARSRP